MAQDRRIVIPAGFYQNGRGAGQFTPANAAQSDAVFWSNQDSVAHWPVPLCMNLYAAAGQQTSGFQGFPPGPNIPQAIPYNCALHPNEKGTLTIWADFSINGTPPLTGDVNQQIQLTTGGMPPVVINSATVTATPPASPSNMKVSVSAALGAVVAQASVAGAYSVNLVATDSLGVQVSQVISITVSS